MIFSDILTIRMKETVWILNISSKIFQGYIVQSAYLSCKLKFFWINNKLLIKTPLKSSFKWGVRYLSLLMNTELGYKTHFLEQDFIELSCW